MKSFYNLMTRIWIFVPSLCYGQIVPAESVAYDYDENHTGLIEAEIANVIANDNGTASAEISIHNETELWYKVYIQEVGEVDIDKSHLLNDSNGLFLFLAPKASSNEGLLINYLPSKMTFKRANSKVFFLADRSIGLGGKGG